MSVPTNIVEGRAQRSDKEFGRFLRVAFGSATELEYHLIMGNEIGAISYADFEPMLAQVIDVKKMLTGLINRRARAVPFQSQGRQQRAVGSQQLARLRQLKLACRGLSQG
jgi:hypothetical protein